MKTFQLLFLILSISLLGACKPDLPDSPQLNPDSQGGRDINPDAPRFWKGSRLPLEISISEDFDNDFVGFYDTDSEDNPFEQMQQNWEDAVPGRTLFTLGHESVTNYEPSSMRGFDDNEIGIYKSYGWYDDISSGALAVTQYFAYRRNIGSPNEYLDMIHADIVLNYRHYLFTMDENNDSRFDLPTVVSHELGHLLGIGHIDSNNAVMNSFLRKNEVKRDLFSLDTDAIEDLYVSGGSSNLNTGQSNLIPSSFSSGAPHPNEGKRVKGMIELRPDGLCQHYEDGQLIHQHVRP